MSFDPSGKSIFNLYQRRIWDTLNNYAYYLSKATITEDIRPIGGSIAPILPKPINLLTPQARVRN
jgi:hypothetical protein